MHFFCIFCLTNCWPCGIMEIRAAGAWAARKKPPMVYPQGVGFSSRHGSHILSAWGVWFTFIFRTPTDHAVGSWGRGLTDSRGSFPLGLPCPPLLCLYYIMLSQVCQALFLKKFPVFKLSLELEEPAKQEERQRTYNRHNKQPEVILPRGKEIACHLDKNQAQPVVDKQPTKSNSQNSRNSHVNYLTCFSLLYHIVSGMSSIIFWRPGANPEGLAVISVASQEGVKTHLFIHAGRIKII